MTRLLRFARNDIQKGFNPSNWIFVIALLLFSWLSIANFTVGFFFPLFVILSILALILLVASPHSVFFAAVSTMMMFEVWFSQIPLQVRDITIRLYPLDLFLFASLLVMVLRSQILKRSPLRSLWIAMLVFDGIALAMGVYSLQQGASWETVLSGLKHFVLYPLLVPLVAMSFRDSKQLPDLAKIVGASGIVMTGFFLFSVIAGQGVWTEFAPLSTYGERFLSGPHALYVSMGILFLTVAMAVGRIPKKWLIPAVALLCLGLISVLFSLFRNLWLGLTVAGLVAHALLNPVARIRTLKVFSIMLVIVLVMVSGIVALGSSSANYESPIYAIQERVNTFLSERPLNDPSSAWRKAVWGEAFEQVKLHPVFGMGYDRQLHFEFEESETALPVRELHNDPLLLLVQFGVVGFVAFTAIIFLTLQRALRRMSNPTDEWIRIACVSAMVLILAASFFASYLQINMLAIPLWIVMGMIWALPSNNSYES